MTLFKSILFLFFFVCISFQPGSAQAVKAFYIGHSLSDQIPDMVKSLADNPQNSSLTWAYQSIPGSPLRWNWQAKDRNDYDPLPPHLYGYYHPQNGLKSGQYQALILTESVPRHISPWGIFETYQYADSFFVYANHYNPDIRVYLYEVWHCIHSGTPTGCPWDQNSSPWRQRLADDLPMWESIVDTLNARFAPDKKVCLIPGGQGLARLSDEIAAGTVSGITDIFQLFSDDIHLTDQGKYFIACIHYAVLMGKSPVGLTHQLKNVWGMNFNPPTPAQAKRFQEIAWETVLNYNNTCFLTTNIDRTTEADPPLLLYPNPATETIHLKRSDIPDQEEKLIFNSQGRIVLGFSGHIADISSLAPGIYFIRTSLGMHRFVKN